MNWNLTRPNNRVAFEQGEPFCRIVPFPRHYLERFETATKSIDEEPEIRERYEQWGAPTSL